MARIDNETVRKILDSADIVEVVSDFVNLKRRGANYIGLCPFHDERTPSFSVSKSKGICKCFSCGKGGSPINFIMLHEQMSYQEALRYLAKKYNIEIKEHELTPQERAEETERESLMAVNDFALNHFCDNLLLTEQGRNIGLSYFRERGINDAMISKFKLGYAIDKRDDFLSAARLKGFNDKYMLETGLVGKTDKNELYDRFRGRVIYPVFKISGKVVAFGGRTLRTDKVGGKYVNSPESKIYRKSYELYGLYQAKPEIVKKDKCILVEGYMDVISMFQKGVENVVASSGTSLTEGQIRLIHRFTDNITVIYDSDQAGIKASLRGIDLILAEGMNVKVLQLPDGDDPDSFAQSHSALEVEDYLSTHEIDFIKFKTNILLKGAENDPIKRAEVISDIVKSISVIPEQIKRNVYLKECSYALEVDERILANEVQKCIENNLRQQTQKRIAEQNRESVPTQLSDEKDSLSPDDEVKTEEGYKVAAEIATKTTSAKRLYPFEKELLRYVVKYGMLPIDDSSDESGEPLYRVIEYVSDELERDDIKFSDSTLNNVFENACGLCELFVSEAEENEKKISEEVARFWQEGEENIRRTASNKSEIESRMRKLQSDSEEYAINKRQIFEMNFIEKHLVSSSDESIRQIATDLIADKYVLSKIHTKFVKIEEEKDQLKRLVPRALYELKNAILRENIEQLNKEIKEEYLKNPDDSDKIGELMTTLLKMKALETEFGKLMGDRVIIPVRRK